MQTRRNALKQAASLAGLLASVGIPQFVQAAYNKAAFDGKSVQEAVKYAGSTSLIDSKDVVLVAPDVAENGASVTLGVSTSLSSVKQMLILVEKNPAPLVALFHVNENIDTNFTIRAKVGQSSHVYAVAIMSDGKALYSKKEVKVTLGGCGD